MTSRSRIGSHALPGPRKARNAVRFPPSDRGPLGFPGPPAREVRCSGDLTRGGSSSRLPLSPEPPRAGLW
ncbi:hypothetical protein GTS_11190 [Gandjariella thermophila]|uniref:Uncharacterized protein n=1 Tax=Gandjariella thermophila TaxID=1931992 RepID=A0A4D4J4M8_9PSEU|nr:hypothetical protein GTS_11190 [Gandjariella thermophila]